MRRGFEAETPIPTRLVSNEEFPPLPQTPAQRQVEERILADAARLAPRLGLSRRDFLRTSGGVATSLLAMNAVFGHFWDVRPVEAADPAAFKERSGDPYFIFDVQLHYVGAGYDPQQRGGEPPRRGQQGRAARAPPRLRRLNPKLASDRGTMADLAWANMVKEVFLDSETDIGLISTPPGPYPQEAVVPPKEMTHIRDEINRVTQSRRMLAHGLITPQLGQVDLDFMDVQAATLKVDAWKGYTGAAPKGFDRGWFVDDEKIAYPMLERARKLGIKRVCLHKGLPLGPVSDYNHPRDVIKAARDFPDIDFVLYHAGLLRQAIELGAEALSTSSGRPIGAPCRRWPARRRRLVLSHHDFEGVPTDLPDRPRHACRAACGEGRGHGGAADGLPGSPVRDDARGQLRGDCHGRAGTHHAVVAGRIWIVLVCTPDRPRRANCLRATWWIAIA